MNDNLLPVFLQYQRNSEENEHHLYEFIIDAAYEDKLHKTDTPVMTMIISCYH